MSSSTDQNQLREPREPLPPEGRILCATDFSDASDEALRQADAWARATSSSLAVVHVVPAIHAIHPLFPQDHANSMLEVANLEGTAGAALAERVKLVTGRVTTTNDVTLHIAVGLGYAEVVRFAEVWNATLTVVGSRGRTGVARLLLGSVAAEIVRYSHTTVLVARPNEHAEQTVGCVLAATDLSAASLPAVEAAAREATRRRLLLKVIHVLDVDLSGSLSALGSPFGVTKFVPAPETMIALSTLARSQIENRLEALTPKPPTPTEVFVLPGAPVTTILDKASELRAELIVVGTRGRTGISRIALGSTAEKVIQAAKTSVLAVRL